MSVIGIDLEPDQLVLVKGRDFKWAFENGQQQATELHYVPLPAELVTQIESYWASELK